MKNIILIIMLFITLLSCESRQERLERLHPKKTVEKGWTVTKIDSTLYTINDSLSIRVRKIDKTTHKNEDIKYILLENGKICYYEFVNYGKPIYTSVFTFSSMHKTKKDLLELLQHEYEKYYLSSIKSKKVKNLLD